MRLPVRVPEVLLPNVVDYRKWSVIACDQFTSQREYWDALQEEIKDAPSTLHLIYPEAYLEDGDGERRLSRIREAAMNYLRGSVWTTSRKGFILVERSTPYSNRRLGLVVSVDLEEYSYRVEDESMIRATEATIEARIPPRLKIRESLPVELPHVLLLLNDEKRSVIEPLYEKRRQYEKLYDFDMIAEGGHVTGYLIPEAEVASIQNALCALIDPQLMKEKYGSETPFLFAVGDGNHSLATAKAYWDKIKGGLNEEERERHPARFALCEVENIYDPGLRFEAIYRLVTGVDPATLTGFFEKNESSPYRMVGKGFDFSITLSADLASSIRLLDDKISEFLSVYGGKVDYVHGLEDVVSLAEAQNGVAFLLPAMEKSSLFPGVCKYGNLPKKTFSMGEAVEKRYYLEAKYIVSDKK